MKKGVLTPFFLAKPAGPADNFEWHLKMVSLAGGACLSARAPSER